MKKKMYSPNQILLGVFLGGPLAGMYFLKSNYDALSKVNESKRTVIILVLSSIALIAVVPFIPKNFPSPIIPLLYLFPVFWVIKKHQLTKETIMESEEYELQSSWQVLRMSISWLLAFIILAFIYVAILISTGVIKMA